MTKKEIKRLTNEELTKLLDKEDWCDKNLIREYDERRRKGKIKYNFPIHDLEDYFQKRRELLAKRQKKKAS